jgi:hypothetical protein
VVSPATALGLGLGAVLALVGAYLVHLESRVSELEDETHSRDPDERG